MTDHPEMGIDAPTLAILPASSKSTCGAHGGLARDGSRCQQPVFYGRARCLWHPEGLDDEAASAHRSAVAATGGRATARPRRLHRTAADPRFGTPAQIIAWSEIMTGRVARGEFTDYRGLDAQLKLARLALDALGIAALEQLDALERLVRGRLGAAGAT